MNFRTIVELPKYDFKITHNQSCVFIGSCFTENIGDKIAKSKINISINPTGIHYNPFSIADTIKTIINTKLLSSEDLFLANDIWNNYNFHSRFSSTSQDKTLKTINEAIKQANIALKNADYLFVTFGTAYAYVLSQTRQIVSNCHKQNAEVFDRIFLSPTEIVEEWKELIEVLHQFNPKLKIVFTVSPIRHWKDGATNNQMSKAALFLAIKTLLESSKKNSIYYFPAYEIVMDELRDYRFYADDMLHPSSSAIEYIWEKFQESFFERGTLELNKRIEKIVVASQHRPFNLDTEEYRSFCKKMLEEIEYFKKTYPSLNFNCEEIAFANS